MYSTPSGNAPFPAVWSPWSEAHHHVGDRLVGDLPDLLDHPGGLLGVALPVGDQHPLVGHHEHAHRGEELLPGGAELFVGIHAGGEFLDPGKIGLGETALEGVRGADREPR